MRKSTFRSLGRDENGKISAIKRKGFTDGTFNYYSSKLTGKNCLMWYAIDPMTGLSVYSDTTRKKVVDYVYSDEFLRKFYEIQKTDKYKKIINNFYLKLIECDAIMEI